MILKNYFKRHLSYFSFLSLLFNSILVFDRVINVAPAGFELFILGLGEASTVKCADCPFREPRFNPSTNMASNLSETWWLTSVSKSIFRESDDLV